jgi:ATP-dependent DNA ligase
MLRHGDKSYEPGKRSSSLVKVKKCMDAEFLVIDVIPSKDGWGILVCKVGAETFRVPAPGTIENKTEILNNKHKYINRYITVEFFEWTNNGIPFHPRAMNWREDV